MRFSSLASGNRLYFQRYVHVGSLNFILLGGSFPSIDSFLKWGHSSLLSWILERDPLQIFRVLSVFLSLLLPLCRMNSVLFVLPVFSSLSLHLSSTWFLLLHHGLEFSLDGKLGTPWSHRFVPHLSGITVFHCLMFIIFVLVLYCWASVYLTTKGEW